MALPHSEGRREAVTAGSIKKEATELAAQLREAWNRVPLDGGPYVASWPTAASGSATQSLSASCTVVVYRMSATQTPQHDDAAGVTGVADEAVLTD